MTNHQNRGTISPPSTRLDIKNGQIRLGIVGCGYVTAMSHLPAGKLVDELQIVALVDLDLDRAHRLAQAYGVPLAVTDHRQILDKVDAVIVAIPHHLHAPVALDFLERGVHVLVEKPMAMSTRECEQMIATAQQSAAKLGVGLVRRFFDSTRLVGRLIQTRFLGDVRGFEAEEAVLFDHFQASSFTVLPPSGGVLLDTGPHTLDLLLWWLGDFDEVAYWDDAMEGVEANCRIQARANDIPGTIELSRTRHLDNQIRIVCQRGTIVLPTQNPTQVFVDSHLFSGPICATKTMAADDAGQLTPYFAQQLASFARSILNDCEPQVPGREGMRSITVIERCKRLKQPLDTMPWMKLDTQIAGRIRA